MFWHPFNIYTNMDLEGIDMLIEAKGTTRMAYLQNIEGEQFGNHRAMKTAGPMTATSWYTQRIQMNDATIQTLMTCDTRVELIDGIISYVHGFYKVAEFPGSKKYLDDRIAFYEKLRAKKEKKPVKRKKPITATLKRKVWNEHIGESLGKAKCLCCRTTDITQLSFHCGHVIAESAGGDTVLSNLKPICQNCNSSMGSRSMDEFMKQFE